MQRAAPYQWSSDFHRAVRSADGSSLFGTSARQQLVLLVRQRSSALCRAWWPYPSHEILETLTMVSAGKRLLVISQGPDYLTAAQRPPSPSCSHKPDTSAVRPALRSESSGRACKPASRDQAACDRRSAS